MKKILDIAKNEYDNVAINQIENFKACDSKEKLVDTLKCFYVNAKKKNNQYNIDTLNEIEKIKYLVRSYPPITKIQSKFEIRGEVLKDQKGNPDNILKRQIKSGFIAGLKRVGCYIIGVINVLGIPAYLLSSGVCKGICLAFDKNSTVNEIGDMYFEAVKATPQCFTKLPGKLIGTETIGSETRYDIYDLETIYYSNGDLYYLNFTERVKLYAKYSNLDPIKVDSVDEIDYSNVIKVIWFLNKDEEENYNLDEFLCLESTTRIRSDFKYYEFINKDASKGKALKIIQDYYNIKDENTIAIGDEENDISMIKRAGIGVAMKNARQSVKYIADYVTENDNDHGGVLEVINKYILKGDIKK